MDADKVETSWHLCEANSDQRIRGDPEPPPISWLLTSNDGIARPSWSGQFGHALRQRHHFHLGTERISHRARVNHQQPMQFQVFERRTHRRRHLRCICPLNLNSNTPPIQKQQQIEFRAGLRSPVIGFSLGHMSEKLLDDETLPRSSDFRVPIKLPAVANAEQRMQESRVPNVNLRGFNQPLTDVLEPRL